MRRIYKITAIFLVMLLFSSFTYDVRDERVCKSVVNAYVQSYLESYKTGNYIKPYSMEENDDTYIYNVLGEINGKRVMMLNTRFKNYSYFIRYRKINGDNRKVNIEAEVDVDYEYEDGVRGGIHNIDYEFTLVNEDEGWTIKNLSSNYDEFEDFKKRVDEKKKVMRGDIKVIIDNCRDEELERLENYKNKPSNKDMFGDKVGCNKISVEVGVKYATDFALKNKEERLFYTAGDSDCTNFVSQCLWASLGNYIPSSKESTVSNIKTEKCMIKNLWLGNQYGGTKAWENVEGFWNFVMNNEALGAEGINNNKSSSELNLDKISEGDVIQVRKRNDYRYSHSVYVTQVKNNGGNRSVYVSQHSYDKLNRNLYDLIFSWGGDECYMRLIKFVK